MTLIKEWLGINFSYGGVPADANRFTGNVPVAAGSTLLRTVGTIELRESANFPHFPPDDAAAVGFGAFQYTNVNDGRDDPGADNNDGDWLWWQQVPFTPDFGTVSAIQSDLIWTGSVYFDSKAQRKVLVSNPTLVVNWSALGDYVGSGTPRRRSCTGKFTLRQLWEHEV